MADDKKATYVALKDNSISCLARKVNDLIERGYEPLGEMVVGFCEHMIHGSVMRTPIYIQRMVIPDCKQSFAKDAQNLLDFQRACHIAVKDVKVESRKQHGENAIFATELIKELLAQDGYNV